MTNSDRLNSSFQILFTVLFRHSYYADERLTELRAIPTQETMSNFFKNSLIIKQLPAGFCVLFDEFHAGKPREKTAIEESGLTLDFTLINDDPLFLNYTSQFTSAITDNIFTFRNSTIRPTSNRGLLHAKDFVSDDDISPASEYRSKFMKKPFGVISFDLHTNLEDVYTIHFQNSFTIWRYIVVSEYYREMPALAIVNKDTKELFQGPLPINLPDGKAAILFESNQPVAIKEKPDRRYQLIQYTDGTQKEYKTIKSILPAPTDKLISRGHYYNNIENKRYSEIFI